MYLRVRVELKLVVLVGGQGCGKGPPIRRLSLLLRDGLGPGGDDDGHLGTLALLVSCTSICGARS